MLTTTCKATIQAEKFVHVKLQKVQKLRLNKQIQE